MAREFRWNGQRLADPDPSMTPEQVRDLYAQMPGYEALTTAAVQVEGEKDGTQIFALAKPQAQAGAVARSTKQNVNFVNSQGARG
jgi:PRTRC genetic system protein C